MHYFYPFSGYILVIYLFIFYFIKIINLFITFVSISFMLYLIDKSPSFVETAICPFEWLIATALEH